jgi:hypothetical protein
MIDQIKIFVGIFGKFLFCPVALLFLVFPLLNTNALASHHYTDKQIDALTHRVGKTFWLNSSDGNLPAFVSAPSAAAASIRPGGNESFLITELTGRSSKNPYYAVRFESGKVAYISPEMFHEALNLTIVSADPRADEKAKRDEREREEKERVEWIQAQPWSLIVKQAAIKKRPTPGLNTSEVKRVLGDPQRVTRLRGPIKVAEEHWFYADGSVLIFHNDLLSKVDTTEKK